LENARQAAAAGTDVAFVPAAADLYPDGFQTTVEVAELSRGLCGDRRPGHFRGVATVVAKLLHIVRPDLAVLGAKDLPAQKVVGRIVGDMCVINI
jgi:pantoate--beta-alanine ligase